MNINTQQVDEKAVTSFEKAKEIVIQDNTQYEQAAMFLRGLKKVLKEIDAVFNDSIQEAHQLHKNLLAKKKTHSVPVLEAEKIIKQKISKYLNECEKKRLEEQRRLEEQARRKQEEEALKAASETDNEDEREEIINNAINEQPVVIAPNVETKVEGISSSKVWDFTIEDQSKINNKFLIPDEKKIRSLVKNIGKDAETIVQGIKVYQKTIIRSRT